MTITFTTDERFREPFRHANSPAAIARFPFPFDADRFAYELGVEPDERGPAGSVVEKRFDVDEHYIAECRERALVLAADPSRCQVLPHMAVAEWDALELLLTSLAEDYPDLFSLVREGDAWSWINRPLGIADRFRFGDRAGLPYPPFEYATRQMQGDFTLQDQRDGTLYVDGGMVTGPGGWSLPFNLGMDFAMLHRPVPVAGEEGLFERARKLLLRLRHGEPVRRRNWALTVFPRLDTSMDNHAVWGNDAALVTADNAGTLVHLRIEQQSLYRLPRSNAIFFSIRTYLASLDDLAQVPGWGRRMYRVFRDLDPRIADYKGVGAFRAPLLANLARWET